MSCNIELHVLDPPTRLNVGGSARDQSKRRTLTAPDMNLSLEHSECSLLSDDLDINVDDIETPDDTDSLDFANNGNELEWEGECRKLLQPFRRPSLPASSIQTTPQWPAPSVSRAKARRRGTRRVACGEQSSSATRSNASTCRSSGRTSGWSRTGVSWH